MPDRPDRIVKRLSVADLVPLTEEPDLPTLLASLQSTAAKLNETADAVNASLNELERRLVDSGVGIEAWVPLPGIRGRALNESFQFGFTKIDGKWRAAVRLHREGQPDHTWTDSDPWPLAEATREIRIASLSLNVVRQLVKALADTAAHELVRAKDELQKVQGALAMLK